MIQVPSGWLVDTAVGAVVFANPERTVQVRYRMRIAPLRSFRAILDEAQAARPEWRTHALDVPERTWTREGEHAILCAAQGAWLHQPARRLIAGIYGDDHVDVVDAISLGVGERDPEVRALVLGATLHLGERRRRVFYAPPPGWRGRATGLVTHWFPPMFPRRPATILAFPANPTRLEAAAVHASVSAHLHALGADHDGIAAPRAIVARGGLEGLHWQVACAPTQGPPIHRDLAVFVRGAYTYALQLDSAHAADADARAAFAAMAATLEPVPDPGVSGGSAHELFAHYA